MTTIPADLKYTKDHEWVRLDGDIATVGITQFAAEALGDVVYVDLPEAGSTITSGETCGEVESTKSMIRQLSLPVCGESRMPRPIYANPISNPSDPDLSNTYHLSE